MADAKIGHWAFLVGFLLAVLAVFVQVPQVIWLLLALGLITGLLNVTAKESQGFLVASIALLLVSSGLAQLEDLARLKPLLGNVLVFVSPAALVVALKEIWSLAVD
ncbi:hypothetical protein HY642_03675 [Candidatus Woesearchaeota archaeon]|nr:hypothetical protein [Candidatus Woesearchaeota archaeon]